MNLLSNSPTYSKVVANSKLENSVIKKIPKEAIHKTGKRKRAIARVWIWKSENDGIMLVNKKTLFDFFGAVINNHAHLLKPFAVIGENINDYNVICYTTGGGISAQSQAIRLAISKCLTELHPEEIRRVLKKAGLLTRDIRIVEPKKTGLRGARKKEQYSKR